MQIPNDLSKLSFEELSELYKKTGSRRVASELHRFGEPPPSTPVAPIVAPRPPQPKYVNFRPTRWKQHPRNEDQSPE